MKQKILNGIKITDNGDGTHNLSIEFSQIEKKKEVKQSGSYHTITLNKSDWKPLRLYNLINEDKAKIARDLPLIY